MNIDYQITKTLITSLQKIDISSFPPLEQNTILTDLIALLTKINVSKMDVGYVRVYCIDNVFTLPYLQCKSILDTIFDAKSQLYVIPKPCYIVNYVVRFWLKDSVDTSSLSREDKYKVCEVAKYLGLNDIDECLQGSLTCVCLKCKTEKGQVGSCKWCVHNGYAFAFGHPQTALQHSIGTINLSEHVVSHTRRINVHIINDDVDDNVNKKDNYIKLIFNITNENKKYVYRSYGNVCFENGRCTQCNNSSEECECYKNSVAWELCDIEICRNKNGLFLRSTHFENSYANLLETSNVEIIIEICGNVEIRF